jgi:hypothetical protein
MRDPSGVVDWVARWAAGQHDVRAVALVGSHARGTASEGSDVDLVLIVDDIATRLQARSWVNQFGEARHIQHEDWGLVQSLRVEYLDGQEVEFGLATVQWATPPFDARTTAVIRGGLKALFDPHDLLVAAQQAAADEDGRTH